MEELTSDDEEVEGEEGDDVYDQFDLGDFTKEEVKRLESIAEPGQRLCDVVSPRKQSAATPKKPGMLPSRFCHSNFADLLRWCSGRTFH